jgi:hypothetical protein
MPTSENSSTTLFTRPLPTNASLENLRKQAKTFLKSVQANDPDAFAELDALNLRSRSSESTSFLLSDAQFVIARRYGFASWSGFWSSVFGWWLRASQRVKDQIPNTKAKDQRPKTKVQKPSFKMTTDNCQMIADQ